MILSIDVGLKNLSYILIDIDSITDFKILEWKNVDVNRSFTDLHWICNNYERFSKQDLVTCLTCLGTCWITDPKKKTKNDLKLKIKEFLRKNKIRKETSLDYQKIIKNLDNQFDNLFQNYAIDYIVIENQPCLKNPTMKSIQMILFTLFCLKTESTVKLMNASEKMKFCYLNNLIHKLPKGYKETKKASIDVVLKVLQNHSWRSVIEESKKKDDLADVFLQALAFFNKTD